MPITNTIVLDMLCKVIDTRMSSSQDLVYLMHQLGINKSVVSGYRYASALNSKAIAVRVIDDVEQRNEMGKLIQRIVDLPEINHQDKDILEKLIILSRPDSQPSAKIILGDFEPIPGFYQPSPQLVTAILSQTKELDSNERIFRLAAIDISLRLMGLLGGLARSLVHERNTHNQYFDVSIPLDIQSLDGIIKQFIAILALDFTSANFELTHILFQEFLSWLHNQPGSRYRAAWGIMRIEGGELFFDQVSIPNPLQGQYTRGEPVEL